ncbi:lipopolysaccharide biosynthesis protein [Streptomyces sp. GSL17-111]|uniref:lipopolysaccharide biosynthesis protein n=1 Tax=Streptomyces sp. GSL17-111 TaxID=3121596 RepID=UPI0030F4613A
MPATDTTETKTAKTAKPAEPAETAKATRTTSPSRSTKPATTGPGTATPTDGGTGTATAVPGYDPPRLRDRALGAALRLVRLLRRALVRRPRPLRRLARWLPRPPKWWPLPACVLLGLLAGGGWGALSTPQYTATGYVVVVPGEKSDPTSALGFAQAYGRLATSGAVLAAAQKASDVPAGTLRGSVRSATSPDAPMIEVTGTATGPGTAAKRANAVAEALAANGNTSAKRTGVELVLFARALPPSAPSSPSAPLAAAVGAAAGGLVGGLTLLARPRSAARPEEPAPQAKEDAR